MKEDRAKKLAENALSDLQAQLEAGHSETLLQFLECVSRFHRYSWLNCVLIGGQYPAATVTTGGRSYPNPVETAYVRDKFWSRHHTANS